MKVSLEQKSEYFEFASNVLSSSFSHSSDCKVIASLSNDGDLLAVCVFTNFTTYDVQMHIASNGKKNWLSRSFLRAVFSYAFVQFGAIRVTAIVDERNTDALRLDRGLGFIDEARLSNYFGSADALVLRMFKSDCKYL